MRPDTKTCLGFEEKRRNIVFMQQEVMNAYAFITKQPFLLNVPRPRSKYGDLF